MQRSRLLGVFDLLGSPLLPYDAGQHGASESAVGVLVSADGAVHFGGTDL